MLALKHFRDTPAGLADLITGSHWSTTVRSSARTAAYWPDGSTAA